MPQLKKVVVAMGNTIIYRDTYDQALAELAGTAAPVTPVAESQTTSTSVTSTPPKSAPLTDPRLEGIRGHLRRYRELSAQGKWAEAGKELEAIEAAVGKQ